MKLLRKRIAYNSYNRLFYFGKRKLMAEQAQYLRLKYPKSAKASLKILFFKDHGQVIAYAPALQVSAYGSDEAAAKEMMSVVLGDSFENLLRTPVAQLQEHLQKLGWTQDKIFKKQYHASSYVDKDGILREFNLSEETEIKETLMTV